VTCSYIGPLQPAVQPLAVIIAAQRLSPQHFTSGHLREERALRPGGPLQ
jgi:hypothetical protein